MKSNGKKTYIILLISYAVVISIVGLRYFNLPNALVEKGIQHAEQVEIEIHAALDNQYSTRRDLLEKISEKYSMDIVVYNIDDGEEIIATIPYDEGDQLLGRVNSDVVILEAQSKVEYNDENMYVYYSIYQLSDYSLISEFYFKQAVAVMVSLIILIVFIFILQNNLYNPLVSIKDTLEKMDNYDLDNISGSYDVINEHLYEFSQKLAQDINLASKSQAKLERKAALLSDRNLRSLTVVKSLIHDLKTPIQSMIIENQLSVESDVEKVKGMNVDNYYKLTEEVNDILTVVKSENIGLIDNDTVDLVQVFATQLTRFQVKSESKGLYINLESPDEILISVDITTLRMLISNLISNILFYPVKNRNTSSTLIKCFFIWFYNQCTSLIVNGIIYINYYDIVYL